MALLVTSITSSLLIGQNSLDFYLRSNLSNLTLQTSVALFYDSKELLNYFNIRICIVSHMLKVTSYFGLKEISKQQMFSSYKNANWAINC